MSYDSKDYTGHCQYELQKHSLCHAMHYLPPNKCNHHCYNYILGVCAKQDNCEFIADRGHWHHSTLPLEFVDLLFKVLKPGVDYHEHGSVVAAPDMVHRGLPMMQQEEEQIKANASAERGKQ